MLFLFLLKYQCLAEMYAYYQLHLMLLLNFDIRRKFSEIMIVNYLKYFTNVSLVNRFLQASQFTSDAIEIFWEDFHIKYLSSCGGVIKDIRRITSERGGGKLNPDCHGCDFTFFGQVKSFIALFVLCVFHMPPNDMNYIWCWYLKSIILFNGW